MFAAQGITAALLARERTGRGQAVDIAMLDSVAALLSYQAGIYFATGRAPGRMGNRHPTIVPYETFSASDGEFVLAVGNDDQWRRFCRVAGLDEDDRFATNRQRVVAYDELKPLLAARLRREPRGYWIERLTAAGVPCGSVRDLAGAVLGSADRRARDGRGSAARHGRPDARAGHAVETVGDARRRSGHRRRVSANTRRRCSPATRAWRRRTLDALRAKGVI